jgi:hypothetical protein
MALLVVVAGFAQGLLLVIATVTASPFARLAETKVEEV